MIRLLLLLSAGLYLTLQFGGQDRGQMRFGLLEAEIEAQELAAKLAAAEAAPIDEPVARAETTATPLPAADPNVVEVAFTAQQPLVSSAAPAAPAAREAEQVGDVRYVAGRSVNVRSGPSTRDGVVGKLTRGDEVTVVWIEENGWARVRVEGDGIDGFMSLDFLTDTAP